MYVLQRKGELITVHFQSVTRVGGYEYLGG